MKIIFKLVLFILITVHASGQKKTALSKDQVSTLKKEGGDFYKSENYREALKRYDQLVNAEPDNVDFNYKLGLCYLKTDIDKRKAAKYLKSVLNKKDAPKDILFYEGEALMYNSEFNEAIESFEKYKEANNGKTNPKMMVDQNIEWCHNALAAMKNPVDVKFENPGKNVNSVYPDFRPVCGTNDTILYFASARKGNMGGIQDGLGDYIYDVYSTTRGDTSWTKAKNAGTNINTETYDEPLFISMNGDKMLVYREGGDAEGDIYFSEIKGKQWNKIATMGEQISDLPKVTGACSVQDNKIIYFSAEMKGTKGGMDIWKIEKDTLTGKWSDPINLGDGVNTKFDEINPWLFPDQKTLFFASQGHNSMGGFDLFKTYMSDPRAGWSKAQNLGYPINTVYDNKYISLNGTGKTGYVSAWREGGIGETDIYRITLTESLITPQPVLVKIKALNASGLPAKEAVCIVTVRSTGEMIGTFFVNGSTGLVNLSLPAGGYRVKLRLPKMGKADEDFDVTGEELNNRKDIVYTLK